MWQLAAALLAVLLAGAVYLLFRRWGDTIWERLSKRLRGDAEYLHRTLGLMFSDWSLSRCRLIVYGSAALGFLVGGLFTFALHWLPNILFALMVAWLFSKMPKLAVKQAHKRYVARFEDQIVDALTMAASALRSGLSLPQALDLITKEMPSPINQEFELALKEQQMGKTLDEALESMTARLPSEDLNLVVSAVLVLRETGGNLSETFDTIVYTISEREKVRGKIKTLTAQGVAQGIILVCMPFVMAWVLHILNPDYMRPMFTTLAGWIFLGFMCLMLFVGALMIRKIVTIDV